jgi:1-acyl-sn-glycerol-3-phosphate acyltransferase
VCADYHLEKGHGAWSFLGCFAWRRRILTIIDREIAEQGIAWPAMRLFGATSLDRLNASREVIKKAIPGWWG